MERRARLLFIVAILAIAPGGLIAQRPASATVRIHVVDSIGRDIPRADLVVVHNQHEAVLVAHTDSTGRIEFAFSPAGGRYTVLARKIGFVEHTDTLHVGAGDTISLEFRLRRAVATLGAVRTTATRLSRYKLPTVDAAEIAGEKRLLLSLGDVIQVLRPDIAYQSHRCVDGEHLRPLVPGPIPPSRRFIKVPANVKVYVNGDYFPGDADPWNSIYADHIAEIHYVNCNDKSIPGLPPEPWPALYVVLKPGYDWDTNRGSFKVP